jgi:hypothetical protein
MAIRDTFHGDKTYAPGESFEAVLEIARRLDSAGLAVPEKEYQFRRLVRVKAIENFEYEGRDRAPGTEFDASYRDAISWAESGQAKVLQGEKNRELKTLIGMRYCNRYRVQLPSVQ